RFGQVVIGGARGRHGVDDGQGVGAADLPDGHHVRVLDVLLDLRSDRAHAGLDERHQAAAAVLDGGPVDLDAGSDLLAADGRDGVLHAAADRLPQLGHGDLRHGAPLLCWGLFAPALVWREGGTGATPRPDPLLPPVPPPPALAGGETAGGVGVDDAPIA